MKLLMVAAMLAALFVPGAAGADSAPTIVELGSDEVTPEPGRIAGIGLQATDPLGLVPGVEIVRLHSLGADVIDVWACDLSVNANTVVTQLDSEVVPYFNHHSRGRLQLDFVARGSASGGADACLEHAAQNASGSANGALIVHPGGGGLAGPGFGESWPSNGRWALVGYDLAFSMVAAHELGHTQSWPHSFTGTIPEGDFEREYDNAIDLMSGNYGEFGTYEYPYDTSVINRYAAGWIDANQVIVLGPGSTSFTLEPSSGSGVQMGVIRSGNLYYTFGARTSSTYDPIPTAWQGVEIYEVTPCPDPDGIDCFNDSRFDMGFRQHVPFGRVSYDFNFGAPLAHVISPGSSRSVGGRTVSVTAGATGAYTVVVSGGSSFIDTPGSVFAADIDWLADAGITKGCNPPTDDRFCPDDVVTRGQMAAFLHRAAPGLTVGTATDFSDDDGLIFEADIEWLSATGVTKGCNPPANTQFCPGAVVTRGQMAAFLHRALPGLTVGTATDFFDDEGLVFESDIEWLAATGVTKGCNPPANTQFCPGAPVTRGAMAAFLHRALGD